MNNLHDMLQTAFNLHQAGQLPEAQAQYTAILQQQPNHPQALHLLGVLAFQCQDYVTAGRFISRALQIHPDEAQYHVHLGLVYQALGQWDKAGVCFQQAIRYQPDWADAHYHLGNFYQLRGRLQESCDAFHTAISLQPSHADALNNLGCVLEVLGRMDEAIERLQQAVQFNPQNEKPYFNLGNVYRATGQYALADTFYRKALALSPRYVDALNNLGTSLKKQGRFSEALDSYNQALQIQPGNVWIHWNKSFICLRLGDLTTGWAENEWRLQLSSYQNHLPQVPYWDGSSLAGKRLLILVEQGFGDTFQLLRYVPLLKAQGATVILETHPEMASFLKTVPGIDELIVKESEAPPTVACDVVCYLFSLPYFFSPTLADIPSVAPDIAMAPERLQHWQARLGHKDDLKIGFVCSGNPQKPDNAQRSCPPQYFAALSQLPGVHLYCLQKEMDPNTLPPELICTPLGHELQDFVDTAAALSCLDLIVTVDTAVAHLAGILGRPVWIVLPHIADWRWLLDRTDSPWYPTARLFRQETPEDWEGTMAQVVQAFQQVYLSPVQADSVTA